MENLADIIEEIAPQLAPALAAAPSPVVATDAAGASGGESAPGGTAGAILRDLEAGPQQMDDVIHRTGLSPQQVCQVLLELELQGLLRQLPGKRYALNSAVAGRG